MARIAPSRQALRHLARLCAAPTPSTASPLTATQHYAQFNLQSTSPNASRTRRGLTTSQCVKQTSTSTTKQPPTAESSNPPPSLPDITTYYTLFPSTLPHGAPPTGPFDISLPSLRKEFLLLQSQHHPDKYTASATAHQKSLALSALINSAYKTLSDPLLRGQYLLLQRYDIDVMSEDNTSHPTDQATLMEVMEAQEGIEDASSDKEIETLKEENKVRIRETEDRMAKAFERDDAEVAKNECVRLKYWRSLQQGLDDWEPGKEVRLIH